MFLICFCFSFCVLKCVLFIYLYIVNIYVCYILNKITYLLLTYLSTERRAVSMALTYLSSEANVSVCCLRSCTWTTLNDIACVWCSRTGWQIVVRSSASDKVVCDVRLFHEHASRGARSRQFSVSVDDRGASGSAHQRHPVQFCSASFGRRQPSSRRQPGQTTAWLRST